MSHQRYEPELNLEPPAFPLGIPLTLYVHLPWCLRKCLYCDFNSYALAQSALPEKAYVDALLADLERDSAGAGERPVESVFIGGGTPSLFSATAIARLLAGVHERVALAPDAEITLEANPGVAEEGRFHDYRQAGVNRLSIGIQSFNAEHLQRLGRSHGRQAAFRAAAAAQAAGFRNFNLDLMFGLPGQTLEQSVADVANAIALEPDHISLYQLTLEPETAFYKRPPVDLPDEDLLWTMQERCCRQLLDSGFAQYEISAYARPERRCRHNLNYWEFGDYLGIGAGAHSKLTAPDGAVQRCWKLQNPRDYLIQAGSPQANAGSRLLAPQELGLEFMMNALRLVAGVPTGLFNQRTGLSLATLRSLLNQARQQELLEWNEDWLRPTEWGRRFLNDLLQLFMPA